MHLDVEYVDSALYARDAIELPYIILDVGHLVDEVAVALEVHLQQR
jgi:hypothetical protein